VGDDYQTEAKTITGYKLVGTPPNANGVITNKEQVVTYVYDDENNPDPDPDGDKHVLVHYLDTKGNKVAEDETLTGAYQDPYETEAKTVDGYKLVGNPTNASGYYAMSDITVVYV